MYPMGDVNEIILFFKASVRSVCLLKQVGEKKKYICTRKVNPFAEN
jgi:hypothetical protein